MFGSRPGPQQIDLRTTCMWEQVLAQRPNCGAPLGLWEVGRALSSAHRTLTSMNRQRPRPAEGGCFWRAERRRVDHWVSENRWWSFVRVNKRNALKTMPGEWCRKRHRLWHSGVGERHKDAFWYCLPHPVVQRTGTGCAGQRHAARLARVTGILRAMAWCSKYYSPKQNSWRHAGSLLRSCTLPL